MFALAVCNVILRGARHAEIYIIQLREFLAALTLRLSAR